MKCFSVEIFFELPQLQFKILGRTFWWKIHFLSAFSQCTCLLHETVTLIMEFLDSYKGIVNWEQYTKNLQPSRNGTALMFLLLITSEACYRLRTTSPKNQKWLEVFLAVISPFYPNVPFLYPLKTSENQSFFDVFRGYGNGTLAWNG